MVTVSSGEGRVAWEKVANDLIARLGLSEIEVDSLKDGYKGKPTSTISVKEAADADAIYGEIVAQQWSETSAPGMSQLAESQPQPIW